MANLKDLQEMAKNGEVSKKLLEDEKFKNELKKALKEENQVEITDEQISQIVKNFETVLQNEEILKEAELENISGGRIGKAKFVKGGSAAVGAILGAVCGSAAGTQLSKLSPAYRQYKYLEDEFVQIENKKLRGEATLEEANDAYTKIFDPLDKYREHRKVAKVTSGFIGSAGGLTGGWALGEYICKKFDIKD